jgi:alpha-L-fucosidase
VATRVATSVAAVIVGLAVTLGTRAVTPMGGLVALAAPMDPKPVDPPAPFGATPTPQQLAWHDTEFYAFVHFNMNTFTELEWGHGTESPDSFNPTALDTRQWARVAKEAGMKAIILTAKHHDGFCLWPSKQSTHTVAYSKWRDGKGDVLKDLSEACKEYGLKMGLYLSPWDRNHPAYGTPEYNEVYKKTLTEILTGYGPLFEVWFDGANGEGPNGRKQVYDWPGFYGTVKQYQPDAIRFSDAADIRWVGNEKGYAGLTNWSTLNAARVYPGYDKPKELTVGDEGGAQWVPTECDVSIRPGWYYHSNEDGKVKSVTKLLDIYHASVGRNCNLLLNLPVDRRGLVNEHDIEALMGLRRALDEAFKTNLARGSGVKATATNVRGQNDARFAASNVIDDDKKSYWATDDGVKTGAVEIDFGRARRFNRLVVQEHIALGQRVKRFTVQVFQQDAWKAIASGTTIGHKRILRFPSIEAQRVRLSIDEALAPPVVSNVEVYDAPEPTMHLDDWCVDELDACGPNAKRRYN